jgi:hypothetical protein
MKNESSSLDKKQINLSAPSKSREEVATRKIKPASKALPPARENRVLRPRLRLGLVLYLGIF